MATKRSKKAKKIASSKKLPLNVKLSGNLNIPGLSNKTKKGSKINMPYFKGGRGGGGKGKGRNGGKSSQTVKVIIQTGQDGKSFPHANVPMPFATHDISHKQVLFQPTPQPTVQTAASGRFVPKPFVQQNVNKPITRITPRKINVRPLSTSSSSSSSDEQNPLRSGLSKMSSILSRKSNASTRWLPPPDYSPPRSVAEAAYDSNANMSADSLSEYKSQYNPSTHGRFVFQTPNRRPRGALSPLTDSRSLGKTRSGMHYRDDDD